MPDTTLKVNFLPKAGISQLAQVFFDLFADGDPSMRLQEWKRTPLNLLSAETRSTTPSCSGSENVLVERGVLTSFL